MCQKGHSVFEENRVDMVFSGHAHTYERTRRLRFGYENNQRVIYIVTGGGGKSLYPIVYQKWYTKMFFSVFHFVGITMTPTILKGEAISETGRVFDKFRLLKKEQDWKWINKS